MEGHQEEYLSNKGHVHAMFVEYLENGLDLQDLAIQDSHLSPPQSPSSTPLPLLDGDVVIPPIADLCAPTFAPNTDLSFDLCIRHDFPFTFPAVDFSTSALISLVSIFNALLNSGCTHHIIRDRNLFSNYVAKEISIRTANCGSLAALGTGDVDFRYSYGTCKVIFTS